MASQPGEGKVPLYRYYKINPDGSIDAIDMAHILHLYGGNDIDGAAPAADVLIYNLIASGGLVNGSFITGDGGLVG